MGLVNQTIFSVNNRLFKAILTKVRNGEKIIVFVEVKREYTYVPSLRANVYSYIPLSQKAFQRPDKELSQLEADGKLIYEGMDWNVVFGEKPERDSGPLLSLPITKEQLLRK